MTRDEAKTFASHLDQCEADLVMIQHRIYRVRQALERIVGHPVGYQYETPNERGGTDDRSGTRDRDGG